MGQGRGTREQARSFFAQQGIKPHEVARELRELEPALGGPRDVQRFVGDAIQRFNGALRPSKRDGVYQLDPGDLRPALDLRYPGASYPLDVTFESPTPEGVTALNRRHPIVSAIADAVLGRALAGDHPAFSRTSAIFTDAVSLRTAVLVLRLRYLLQEETQQFAEEVVLAAFRREGQGIVWLQPLQEEALQLLRGARPVANMPPAERQDHVAWALGMLTSDNWYAPIVEERRRALEDAHMRLRSMVQAPPLTVDPYQPDILGCYVLVPAGGRG